MGATTEYNRSSQSHAPLPPCSRGPRGATIAWQQYATLLPTRDPKASHRRSCSVAETTRQTHRTEILRIQCTVRAHMSLTRKNLAKRIAVHFTFRPKPSDIVNPDFPSTARGGLKKADRHRTRDDPLSDVARPRKRSRVMPIWSAEATRLDLCARPRQAASEHTLDTWSRCPSAAEAASGHENRPASPRGRHELSTLASAKAAASKRRSHTHRHE